MINSKSPESRNRLEHLNSRLWEWVCVFSPSAVGHFSFCEVFFHLYIVWTGWSPCLESISSLQNDWIIVDQSQCYLENGKGRGDGACPSCLAGPWTWLGPLLGWVFLGGCTRPGWSSWAKPINASHLVWRPVLGNSFLNLSATWLWAQHICMWSWLEICRPKTLCAISVLSLACSFFLYFSLFNIYIFYIICVHR